MHIVRLNDKELLRLKLMDAYEHMDPKNVRYLCKLFGIHHSTFYRLKKQYNKKNLASLKYKSRKPKNIKTIDWNTVVEICDWKRTNPRKSQYYLYHIWIKEGRVPPCSPKTIYNWWKKRNLIVDRHKRRRSKSKLFNNAKNIGDLVQIDTKYLPNKQYQYTAIDVLSKWRFVLAYPKLNMENTINFIDKLLAKTNEKRITIKIIQMDNGKEFQSLVETYITQLGIKHQHTWIHTPDQNGVVERSHRTDEEEFYQETEIDYKSLNDINTKLKIWLEYYNTKRLHFSLNYLTPEEYLVSHI
jgi:transposase InsO family protein